MEGVSDWFWDLIRRADKNRDTLRELLAALSAEEIYRFADEFGAAAVELTDEPYLEHVNPDESEDGVDDIARWVVSQGKETYLDVLAHPERIPKHVDAGDPAILYGVAQVLYRERFGRKLDVA